MRRASQDVDLLAVGLHAGLVKVGVLGDLLGVVAAVAVVALGDYSMWDNVACFW